MDKATALKLLETAPYSNRKSKVNQVLTQIQVVDIVRNSIVESNKEQLDSLTVKRVWQAVKNQRKPRY